MGPVIGFTEADISALSLCVRGGMYILMAWVDLDIMHLVGRWWSNNMIR